MAEKTVKSSLTNPDFGTCCSHGQVQLSYLQRPPEPLLQLLTQNDAQAKNFKEHIWEYNRALAFTSLGVTEDHSVNRGRGPPVFRVQGELCHRSGSLLPDPGHKPIYAQLYIFDPHVALQYRMQNNPQSHLRDDTMALLQDVIRDHHQYAPIYLHAFEVLRHQEADDICIRLRVVPGTDRRRYNLPTADEVAVILPGDQSQAQPRDIILRNRGGALQRISDCHPAYAPLQYVLLFPYGENGWHPDLLLQASNERTRKRITLTRYTAFRLHNRQGEFSCLLRGGRLFQRYLVDMWATADQQNLTYLRNNQDKFRRTIQSGLEDAMNSADGDIDLNELGQRTVLPSSYIGGPRHMQQRFQDSMAIARYFRKVDAFITMTTNARWPEIMRELLPGETPYDRPDLVARVFQMKKKALIQEILDGQLGRVAAYVYTIEFQKRGLPHVHILVFFDHPHKLSSPQEIDRLISAQWPNPVTEPLLFSTVKSCMIHGPCGTANPNAPCMEDGRCTKRYPKDWNDHGTNMDVNGYPDYYRPNDGRAYQVGNHMVDNRWIIPYCPYLSAKYDCHINFECAVSLSSFKYVFKYIQKGGDRATMELYRRDEIKRFIDGRYVSASEAAWRIFHFDMHDQQPNIVRLQVHLPGQSMINFNPNDNPETLRNLAAQERTTLTAFFTANCDDGPLGNKARKLTYQEFPQRFVWKNGANEKHWALRKQGFALGRMYFVAPTSGERFYLRTLLTIVKGATSFLDLRTYDGKIYDTYQDACLARGLLEDDGEWRECLKEASEMQTGSRLCQLFSTLLLFCEPSQPALLWHEFRHHICDDLRHVLQIRGRENLSEEQIYDFGLHLLNKLLEESGKSLSDWPTMPQPQHDWSNHYFNPLIAEHLDYDPVNERTRHEERVQTLNEEQHAAYRTVIASVNSNNAKLFFLNGPGGTGKTYVYNTICHKLRSEGDIVLAVASSGIAALLIVGGRTAYSIFKIPIEGLTSESFCNIPKDSHRAVLMRMVKLIIWDEVGMQHRHAIEAVDRTLRDIRNSDKPFGDLTILFGGDFQQILPVVPRGTREEVVNATLQRSYLWPQIEVLHLCQNMRLGRQDDDRHFSEWLINLGHGRLMAEDNTIEIAPDMISNSPNDLIDFIYPRVNSHPPPPPEYFQHRMILAPRNDDVSDINQDVLDRMAGESRTYYSADKIISEAGADSEDDQPIPVEFLRSINSASLPPGELTLKVGCPLILLRNLCPARGLCNGTRMILTAMQDRVLEVRIVGGDHDGETALLPRISLIPQATADFAFKFRRRQFPVRLAFALTINKAQGQSVTYVGLDLRIPVFTHGQLYVAFSRATSRSRIRVLLPETQLSTVTKNVVYPEILLD